MSDTDDVPIMRDEKGRVLPGSKLGKLNTGKKKTTPASLRRERRSMQKKIKEEAQNLAQDLLAEKLEDVLGVVYERAMQGDVKALSLWMRHSAPVAQPNNKVDTDVLAEVANLPAEERLRYINRAMLEGEIDVTMGKDLLQAQKAEMEATTLNRIQKLARRVTKEELSLEQLAHEFGQIAEDLEPVLIEGRTDGEG